jgi:hypothetical protein
LGGQRGAYFPHLTAENFVRRERALPRQLGAKGVSMKRSWAALAVGFAAMMAVCGCNDYGNTFQGNTGASISFLSPSNIPAGSGDFTLTINGAGFVAQTFIEWNGKKVPTTVAKDSSGNVLGSIVSATISGSLIAKPGLATVNTQNPFSGAGTNGLSNTVTFIINNPPNPTPAISSLSPSCVTTGSGDTALTISGSNFLTSSDPTQISSVRFQVAGGQPVSLSAPASSITSSQIQTTIPAAQLAVSGSAMVIVSNPPSAPLQGVPGSTGSGGGSASAAFTIQTAACPSPNAAKASVQNSAAEETPAVSFDGRYVAYTATQDSHSQIFVRDTCVGASSPCQPRTLLISVGSDGAAANDDSHSPSMSSDGRFIAFSSAATNLASDSSGSPQGIQIFLRDTCFGAEASCKPSTQLVSTDPTGALVGTNNVLPSVSASGRFVAFLSVKPSPSSAPAQRPGASSPDSGFRQVFVRDTCLGAPAGCGPSTTRISLQPGAAPENPGKPAGPAISGDSRLVAAPGAGMATLFTHSVAIDDRVFLAATKSKE